MVSMDLGVVISIVGSAVAIVGAVIALFLWTRSEANADRRDIVNLILAIKEEISAIHLEVRDFHNRLVAIEERRK